MTNAAPLLEITDGTIKINLLDPYGFLLLDWIPALAEPKGGGQWADSPLVEGRKLVYMQLGNVIDTFELKVKGIDQNEAIYRLQELRRLLEKAREYWTSDAQNVPVYIRARAAYETNIRYAVIMDYRTPKDANPFKQPFFDCNPLVDGFLLTVEHGCRQDNVPGGSECVEISAEQYYTGGLVGLADYPDVSSDDCTVDHAHALINLGLDELTVGTVDFIRSSMGIRFTSVAVPVGATIVNAWIDLVCTTDLTDPTDTVISADAADDAATFSTYADFANRLAASVGHADWHITEYGNGNTISTPDISSTIQTIVDRAGWVNGNDIAIFFEGGPGFRRFASISHTTYASPVLYILYSTTGNELYGQAATCENQVFIINKQNQAALTNIFMYDHLPAPAYTELLGDATPYALLPGVPTADDAVYFGSTMGPFNNLVFDLSQVQTDLTTIVWEYLSNAVGPAFSTLTVKDNTATTDPFDKLGVNSVHWVPPSGWVSGTVNGVAGYWIRARVTVVGASPDEPQQDNRDVYTALWPHVEMQADQILGDIPALARIEAYNQSDAATGSPVLHTNRLIIGSRSLSRGDNFTPFLNVSDAQNISGVTVTLGANTTYSSVSTTPTSRLATYTSPAAVGTTTEATITLDSTIASEYLGRFRAFLRYKYNTGAADAVSMRLITTPGGSGLARYSEYVFPQNNTDWQVADFGIVEIPHRAPNDDYGTITFAVEITRDTAGRVVYLYDLVLMPVDEWATDAVDKSGLAARTGAVGNGDLLDIDSVTYPRAVDQAILRQVSDGRIIGYFQNRQPGPALLQANRAQRLWFFAMMYESGTELSSPISISHSVQVYRVQRYLSARGRR